MNIKIQEMGINEFTHVCVMILYSVARMLDESAMQICFVIIVLHGKW
jgi:hypothetical protein